MQILILLIVLVVVVSAILLTCGLFLFNKNICKEYDVEIEEIIFSTTTFRKDAEQVNEKYSYRISDLNEACLF